MAKDQQLTRLHVKVPRDLLRILDGWRRKQPDLPSRSEAIRRLVASGAAVRVARSSTGRVAPT
jgi:metal-responsive CopG/Arc/MetJ family transcriptional regulator